MHLFTDDYSLFTCVNGITETHDKLLKDLQTISIWAYQWKMVFNPKQVIEVIFSCKNKKPGQPKLSFNGITIAGEPFTNHIPM